MSESNLNVEIYDMVGKLVQSIPNVSANETFTVQNDLPTGIYFVRITQNENSTHHHPPLRLLPTGVICSTKIP